MNLQLKEGVRMNYVVDKKHLFEILYFGTFAKELVYKQARLAGFIQGVDVFTLFN